MRPTHKQALILTFFLTVSTALNATLMTVYDSMVNAEGSGYAAQQGTEAWTFHKGDENGVLMNSLTSLEGYGNAAEFYQFSNPGEAGAGTGVPIHPSLATGAGIADKKGIFTHTAATGYVTAVLNIFSTHSLADIFIDYEMVIDGTYGNGMDFMLRTIQSGVVTDYQSVEMTSSVNMTQNYNFGQNGLVLNAGDKIAVLFEAKGNYWYDHGWWNIRFDELAVPNSSTTRALAFLAIAGLLCFNRRIKQKSA